MGAPSAALFGTVVLERVIDSIMVIVTCRDIAISLRGAGEGGILAQIAIALIPVAIAPLIGLVLLRVAPDLVIGFASWLLRPFPVRFRDYLLDALARFTAMDSAH